MRSTPSNRHCISSSHRAVAISTSFLHCIDRLYDVEPGSEGIGAEVRDFRYMYLKYGKAVNIPAETMLCSQRRLQYRVRDNKGYIVDQLLTDAIVAVCLFSDVRTASSGRVRQFGETSGGCSWLRLSCATFTSCGAACAPEQYWFDGSAHWCTLCCLSDY